MKIEILNRSRERMAVSLLRRDAIAATRLLGVGNVFLTIAIVYVDPIESRRLKRMFLKKNAPANVLSFNYGDYAEVILTPSVIRSEARREHVPFLVLLRRLLIHGLVHISGSHHEASARDARDFHRRERAIFEKQNIPSGTHR